MAKKVNPTLLKAQQEYYAKIGLVEVKAVASKKDAAGTIYPLKFRFTYDDNEVELVSDGLYKYVKSETKLGSHVQVSIEDIKKWERSKNIVICHQE